MNRTAVALGLVLPLVITCQPSVGVTKAGVPRPSGGDPVAAVDGAAAGQDVLLDGGFSGEAEPRAYKETGHYAEDVTVNGTVARLGSPYATDCWVGESLKGYEVTVVYEPTRRACRLAEGRHAHPQDAGKIL